MEAFCLNFVLFVDTLSFGRSKNPFDVEDILLGEDEILKRSGKFFLLCFSFASFRDRFEVQSADHEKQQLL